MSRLVAYGLVGMLCISTGARAIAAPPANAESDDDAMGRRLQALLRQHPREIFGCVAKQQEPVTGETLLRVVVGRHGEAARVEVLKVEEGRAAARAVAECIAGAARTWDYTGIGAAEGEQLVFPLQFRPEPVNDSAIGATIELLSLKPNMSRSIVVAHTTAFYVVGPGAPSLRSGAAKLGSTVGDVFLAQPGQTIELVSTAATGVLKIEATSDSAPERAKLERFEARKLTSYPIAAGRGEVRLYLDGVSAPFAIDRLCAKKDVDVPRHEHTSDEIVYVVSGRATTTVGDQAYADKPGDVVSIPRSTPHALHVDQDLCSVQVYAPGGPEQRFKRPTP